MIHISRASLSDNQKILGLERKVWKEFLGLSDVADKYDLSSFIRFEYVFVAKEKGKVIGAIVAIKTREGKVFVADWVVDKKYRDHGVGMNLYKRLVRAANHAPIETLVSERYDESVELHKRMGFKIKDVIKDAYGVHEKEKYYLMEKPFSRKNKKRRA
jgi:L-amino acid N-acyltransferase YncA